MHRAPESFANVHVIVDWAVSALHTTAPDNTTFDGSGRAGGGVPQAGTGTEA